MVATHTTAPERNDEDGGRAKPLVGRVAEVVFLLLFAWVLIVAASTIWLATGDERAARWQMRQWWNKLHRS